METLQLHTKISILATFLFVALTWPSIALAHSPYFKDFSQWQSHGGEEYILQGWYGDGIFAADPVKIVLKHSEGGFSAVSGAGSIAGGFCPSLKNCWGFTSHLGLLPTIWKLNLNEIQTTPTPVDKSQGTIQYGYPEYIKEQPRAFVEVFNPLLWPIAWYSFIKQNLHFYKLLLPIFLLFLGCWYTLKKLRTVEAKQNLKKILLEIFKILLFLAEWGIIVILAFIAFMYSIGILWVILFLIWIVIVKLASKRKNNSVDEYQNLDEEPAPVPVDEQSVLERSKKSTKTILIYTAVYALIIYLSVWAIT